MSLLPELISASSLDDDFNFACSDLEARLFVENLWKQYKEHADKDFTKKITEEFHNHFWEMYLTCVLKENNCDVLPKTKRESPDVEINSIDFTRIWVEAVAASSGNKEDKVPLPKLDNEMWFHVPEERIVLRYTSVIAEKYKKYLCYRRKNIVKASEPYVIAVNGSKVPYSWDDEIPYIIQAVLPIGLPIVQVDWDSPEKSTTGYAHRPQIKKLSGSPVATNIFFKKEYRGISGIIFSKASIREFDAKMGNDFIFIHNPLALNKLPEGWLKIGCEYRVEKVFLECRRWS